MANLPGRRGERTPIDSPHRSSLGRGFISFENSGELIISPVTHRPSLQRMGVPTEHVVNVGTFTDGQKYFLDSSIAIPFS
jgi:hypothetical protein